MVVGEREEVVVRSYWGSVDSARRRAEIASLDDNDGDEESTIPVDVENRVLVVVDDKKVRVFMHIVCIIFLLNF